MNNISVTLSCFDLGISQRNPRFGAQERGCSKAVTERRNTRVSSRWVSRLESEGEDLAEREFLFREVGLERWTEAPRRALLEQ